MASCLISTGKNGNLRGHNEEDQLWFRKVGNFLKFWYNKPFLGNRSTDYANGSV